MRTELNNTTVKITLSKEDRKKIACDVIEELYDLRGLKLNANKTKTIDQEFYDYHKGTTDYEKGRDLTKDELRALKVIKQIEKS